VRPKCPLRGTGGRGCIFVIMDKEQFQFAFDFFGEPEKPADELPAPNAPEAKKEDKPEINTKAQEPLEVYFPEPLPEATEGAREYLSGMPIDAEPAKPKSKRGRKSQKAMAEEVELVQVPVDEELYQKQYYGISEVATMFAVNTSLLRYWEGEFNMQLRKNRKGDRFFTPQDIKTIQLIHDLLRRRKFTIDGARDFLKKNKGADQRYQIIQSLQGIRKFLLEVKANL
jgi:DNA-binding transcriptional MerR regulator